MAQLFHREDSHFLVFFDADKTVQLLPKQKITFLDEDNVTVFFPTSNLREDGTEEIEDIAYTGRVFFSGSASKCRGMKSKIDEGDGGERDTDFFTSLQNQAKEVKSCGKRGASIKLKRALEEETREMAAKKGQKQKSKSDSTTTSAAEKKTTKRKTKTDTPLSELEAKKSKSQITKDLKLKEMMAFAGVSSAESPKVSDSNISMESQSRQNKPQCSCSPRKEALADSTSATGVASGFQGRQTETLQHINATVPSETSTKKIVEPEQTTSATSMLVSSSLNLLNSNDLEPTDLEYNNTGEVDFSDAYYVPEYGYNSDMGQSETCGQSSPIQNVIGYYQQLDPSQQGTILGFLNMLSSELHGITYGQSPSSSTNPPNSSNMTGNDFSVEQHRALSADASTTDENERKVPLIMDKDDIFKDVLVNPSKLRNAESSALMAKHPAAFLLNKVLDLVFRVDELKTSKGVKGLNTHKMEAISEYLFAWCTKMDIENVSSKTQTTIVQNKIGNLRFKGVKKTKLAKKMNK